MIKAEVIEYPGTEVPNWVNKCRAVLTSLPAYGLLAISAIAVVAAISWQSFHPTLTGISGVQSQPANGSNLQVYTASQPAITNLNPTLTPTVNASTDSKVMSPNAPYDELQVTGTTQNALHTSAPSSGQNLQSTGSVIGSAVLGFN